MSTTLQRLLQLYPDKPWNFHGLLQNPGVDPEFILRKISHSLGSQGEFFNLTEDDWCDFSRMQAVTPEFVMAHLGPFSGGRGWNWDSFSLNPSFTPEFIMTHPDFPPDGWNWSDLSLNSSFTPEFIMAHPDQGWDWYSLSYNPSITLELIRKFFDRSWDWDWLSRTQASSENPL